MTTKRVDDQVLNSIDIPVADWYVVATDTFLSNWGKSDGKKNILVLPCDSYDQAEIVHDNCQNRSDMTNVEIFSHNPRLNFKRNLVQLKTIESMPNWYRKGAF